MSPSRHTRGVLRAALLGSALAALSACETFDIDLRPAGMDTTDAVRRATAPRPAPDDRGVISYPNYQVVVARPGDTVADVARRIGLDPDELARYNGLSKDVPLRGGEILALPRRVSEPSPATGAPEANTATGERIDITTLADNAMGLTHRLLNESSAAKSIIASDSAEAKALHDEAMALYEQAAKADASGDTESRDQALKAAKMKLFRSLAARGPVSADPRRARHRSRREARDYPSRQGIPHAPAAKRRETAAAPGRTPHAAGREAPLARSRQRAHRRHEGIAPRLPR